MGIAYHNFNYPAGYALKSAPNLTVSRLQIACQKTNYLKSQNNYMYVLPISRFQWPWYLPKDSRYHTVIQKTYILEKSAFLSGGQGVKSPISSYLLASWFPNPLHIVFDFPIFNICFLLWRQNFQQSYLFKSKLLCILHLMHHSLIQAIWIFYP